MTEAVSQRIGTRLLKLGTPREISALGEAMVAALTRGDRDDPMLRILHGEAVEAAALATHSSLLEATGVAGRAGSKLRAWFRGHLVEGFVVLTDPLVSRSERARAYLDPLWEAPTLARTMLRRGAALGLDMGCGCGVLALVLSRWCGRVIGIDVTARAVAVARFNALLNGVSRVEFHRGDLFVPVANQRFGQIVFNSPTHDEGKKNRDLLHAGERVLERFFTAVIRHLEARGFCQANVGMLDNPSDPFVGRLRRWLGADAGRVQVAIHITEREPRPNGCEFKRGHLTLHFGAPGFVREISAPLS